MNQNKITPSSSSCLGAKRCRNLNAGFTLVELLVVLAIVAVLFLIATPNYDSVMVGSRVDDGRMTVATSLAMARSEAVKRGQNVSLCIGAGVGTSCDPSDDDGAEDWSEGWRVIINGADEPLLQSIERGDNRVSISYNCGTALSFNAGGARANGAQDECVFTISDAGGDSSYDKVLRIARTGRVRLE